MLPTLLHATAPAPAPPAAYEQCDDGIAANGPGNACHSDCCTEGFQYGTINGLACDDIDEVCVCCVCVCECVVCSVQGGGTYPLMYFTTARG